MQDPPDILSDDENEILNDEIESEEDREEDDEEDPEEGEEYGWDRDDDDVLYDGAPLTVGESMLAILTFALRYKLSGSCLDDLLSLIALHCRQEGNRCRKSTYQFRKFFENIQFPINRHYYCPSCFVSVPQKNGRCGRCGSNAGNNFFIQIPILNQVRTLYKRPGFAESLQHREHRRKRNADNYEDIFDGAVYRELSGDGNILSDPTNISLTWNTDGVSIFKSSRYQIWPFYLVINELAFNQRTALQNTYIAWGFVVWLHPASSKFVHAPIQK